MKEYREFNDQSYKVEVKYSLDGYRMVGGRGYYLSILPVEIENRNGIDIETWIMDGSDFSMGLVELLKECGRKSKKTEENCINMVTDSKIDELIKKLDKIKKH